GELCKKTKCEQTNISHQLKLLERCKIVSSRRDGKKRIYSLNDDIRLLIKQADKYIKKNCTENCKFRKN
ncbi:MAG: hypothetical protein QXM75_04405, partial [Candidatus Diapherotrites archaeon]